MKKILLFTFIIISTFGAALAQLSPDDVAMFQSLYGQEKRDVVKQHLKLSETESAAFWPLYDEYEIARKEIGKKRIQILETYAKNYSTLTDVTVDNLMTDLLSQTEAMTKLQAKYFAKFKKVMPPLKAAQLMQLEIYMDNAVKVKVAESIPFIGQMDSDD